MWNCENTKHKNYRKVSYALLVISSCAIRILRSIILDNMENNKYEG